MRILYIGNMDDIHTPKWAQWFIDNGHEVTKMHIKGLTHGLSLIFFKELIKHIHKEIEPDIIHAHYAGSWGLIGCLVKGKIPYMITVHGSEVLLTRGIKRLIVGWILRQADLVTTDSVFVRAMILKMGVDKDKVRVIRFGVDVEKYKKRSALLEGGGALRLREEVNQKRTVVFRTGEGKIYDEETVIKAIEYVRDQGIFNIEFVPIIGLNEAQLIDLFQKADLYISTALSDAGIASTTAEAMACELPVLVSDCAENRNWVTYREDFDSEMLYEMQLFRPMNYTELARKIIWFCGRENFRKYFGELNRKRIKEHNDYHREMSKMQTIYQEAKDGNKKSRPGAKDAGRRE